MRSYSINKITAPIDTKTKAILKHIEMVQKARIENGSGYKIAKQTHSKDPRTWRSWKESTDFSSSDPKWNPNYCYYSAPFHNGRLVKPAFFVHMKGKHTKYKWRRLCKECCHQFDSGGLLDEAHGIPHDNTPDSDVVEV